MLQNPVSQTVYKIHLPRVFFIETGFELSIQASILGYTYRNLSIPDNKWRERLFNDANDIHICRVLALSIYHGL